MVGRGCNNRREDGDVQDVPKSLIGVYGRITGSQEPRGRLSVKRAAVRRWVECQTRAG
jgi:hypothetical protein